MDAAGEKYNIYMKRLITDCLMNLYVITNNSFDVPFSKERLLQGAGYTKTLLCNDRHKMRCIFMLIGG